jgi:hypothetical protein
VPLRRHPAGGIVVPFVARRIERTGRCRDLIPAPLVVERASQRRGDVPAASTGPSASIELLYELVVEVYVHAHVHMMTQRQAHFAYTEWCMVV